MIKKLTSKTVEKQLYKQRIHKNTSTDGNVNDFYEVVLQHSKGKKAANILLMFLSIGAIIGSELTTINRWKYFMLVSGILFLMGSIYGLSTALTYKVAFNSTTILKKIYGRRDELSWYDIERFKVNKYGMIVLYLQNRKVRIFLDSLGIHEFIYLLYKKDAEMTIKEFSKNDYPKEYLEQTLKYYIN